MGLGRRPARHYGLAREYNDRFNNLRLRSFDRTAPAAAGDEPREHLRDGSDLSRHQKDARSGGSCKAARYCWRTSSARARPGTMAAAAMEMRRLAASRKNRMFVVPNHLVEQWGAAEFLKVYPQARLFIAGPRAFCHRQPAAGDGPIASGNYDAVIVSAPLVRVFCWCLTSCSNVLLSEQVEELEASARSEKPGTDDNRRHGEGTGESQANDSSTKLKERADREGKDNTFTFEELPPTRSSSMRKPDLYKKNLFYTTKMNRIAGLPNSESNRALRYGRRKTRYVLRD